MKIWDWIRGKAAEGESVASDELAAVIPAWRNFLPKWQTYSKGKKAFAIGLPLVVLVAGVSVGLFGVDAVVHKITGARDYVRGDVVTHADLEKSLEKAFADFKSKQPLPTSSTTIAQMQTAIVDLQRQAEAAPSALEFKDYQNDIAELQAAIKALEQKKPPKNKLTTSSIKKEPPVSITDPSTWKITP